MVSRAGVRLRESRDLCDPAIRAQCACVQHTVLVSAAGADELTLGEGKMETSSSLG